MKLRKPTREDVAHYTICGVAVCTLWWFRGILAFCEGVCWLIGPYENEGDDNYDG